MNHKLHIQVRVPSFEIECFYEVARKLQIFGFCDELDSDEESYPPSCTIELDSDGNSVISVRAPQSKSKCKRKLDENQQSNPGDDSMNLHKNSPKKSKPLTPGALNEKKSNGIGKTAIVHSLNAGGGTSSSAKTQPNAQVNGASKLTTNTTASTEIRKNIPNQNGASNDLSENGNVSDISSGSRGHDSLVCSSDDCWKSYSTLQQLNRHKKFKCEQKKNKSMCGRAFKLMIALHNHQKLCTEFTAK